MEKKIEHAFYDLLSKKLSGDATQVELEELGNLLHQYPRLQFLYDQVMRPPAPRAQEQHTSEAYAAHYARILLSKDPVSATSGAGKAVKTFFIRKHFLAAAAVIAAIVFSAYFFVVHKSADTHNLANTGLSKNEMQTARGSKSKITLPDGSLVVLNADSKLSYTEDFNRKKREVQLTGEAFFDVKHDAAKLFIVHTVGGDVRVLGTAFNVRSYPGENSFETSLIRGEVEVKPLKQQHEKFVLKPSEKLIIRNTETDAVKPGTIKNNGGEIILTHITAKDSLVAETSWIQNQLIFSNKPLADITADLERQFDIKVIFKTDGAKNYRYTVHLDNYSLEETLAALQSLKKFRYSLNKNTLVIE